MTTRLSVFGVLSIALLLCSCCCVDGIGNNWHRYQSDFEKSYSIQTPANLVVKNIDGFVYVSSWDKNEVFVKGVVSLKAENEKEALRRMKEINIIISRDGNTLTIKVERKRRAGLYGLRFLATGWRVDLEVSVPRDCSVAISAVDGAVRVGGVKGKHDLSTVDGDIDAQNLEGVIDCRSVDGSCRVTDVRGDLEISTTDGRITAQGEFTGLKATAVDGSIHVAVLDGSVIAEEWKLSSVNGSITLGVPESLSADLEASTVDGHVSIEVPAELRQMTERRLTARLGKGGSPISISTTDGSIRIEPVGAKETESDE